MPYDYDEQEGPTETFKERRNRFAYRDATREAAVDQGRKLRESRVETGLRCGEVARAIQIKVTDLVEIEHGRKEFVYPFAYSQVAIIARGWAKKQKAAREGRWLPGQRKKKPKRTG